MNSINIAEAPDSTIKRIRRTNIHYIENADMYWKNAMIIQTHSVILLWM